MPRFPRSLGTILFTGSLALGGCSAGTSVTPSVPASAEESAASTTAQPSAASTTPAPTPADATAAAGLAFVRAVDGLEQVFVVDPDGSQRQVSGLAAEHASIGGAQPAWSPDRSMIAFGPPSIGSGLDAQLWVVRADGSQQRSIATLGESIEWSPDSTRLLWTDSVFTTDNTGEYARMWIGDVASGEVTQLGPRGNVTRWLPDGERISFLPPESEPHIVVLPVDGGEPEELIAGVGPWWSPDGELMLVEREDGMYVAGADGTDARLLLAGAASPAWSPDGTRIAFGDIDDGGNFVVGVADVEGNVLWTDVAGSDASWSPDGTKLAVEVYDPDGPFVRILDGETGAALWELEGRFPDW